MIQFNTILFSYFSYGIWTSSDIFQLTLATHRDTDHTPDTVLQVRARFPLQTY